MKDHEDQSLPSQGGSDDQSSATAKALLKAKIDALPTVLKRDRVYAIHDWFGNRSFDIIDFFADKQVPQQWKKFTQDIEVVNDLESPMHPYYKALVAAFVLGTATGMFEIIYQVRALRVEHKLPQLGPQVTKEALADFGKVFLFDKNIDDSGVENYTPSVIKLYR